MGKFLFTENCFLSEVVLLFLVRPAWLPRTVLQHCKAFNEDHVVIKKKGNNYKECTAACFFMHSVPFLQIRYLYNWDFALQIFCQNTDGIHLKISGCLTQAGHVNTFENEVSIMSLCFGFLIQWEFCHRCQGDGISSSPVFFLFSFAKQLFVTGLGKKGNSLQSKENAYILNTTEYWGKPVAIFSLSLQSLKLTEFCC